MVLLNSFTMPWGVKLARVCYHFVKLKGNNQISWFGYNGNFHGLEYCFYLMLIASVVFAAIYYFGIANKVQNATKQNYRSIYVMGYLALVILSCAFVAAFVTLSAVFSWPMLQVCLWNILWYSLLFEVCSLLMRKYSKAENIHLLTCWN